MVLPVPVPVPLPPDEEGAAESLLEVSLLEAEESATEAVVSAALEELDELEELELLDDDDELDPPELEEPHALSTRADASAIIPIAPRVDVTFKTASYEGMSAGGRRRDRIGLYQ